MPFWVKGIPNEIQDEIKAINKFTRKTGREASITVCRKPNSARLLVANNTEGAKYQTMVAECDTPRYGTLERVGDVHTHPSDEEVIGIVPSEADFYSNLVDTYIHKRPQVSCVTSPESDLSECYIPKSIPDSRKLQNYERALAQAQVGEPGFFIDNVGKDFDIEFFSNPQGQYIPKPAPKEVVKASFGESKRDLQNKLGDFEKGGFCSYIQSATVPSDDRVHDACRAELRKRNILGVIEY